jgi:p24 family protein beta-1
MPKKLETSKKNKKLIFSSKFCFSNLMSTLTPKTVSFNIHVGDVLDPHLANLEHIDPIEKSIMRLSEGLSNIQNEQKYLRLREMTHRDSKTTKH